MTIQGQAIQKRVSYQSTVYEITVRHMIRHYSTVHGKAWQWGTWQDSTVRNMIRHDIHHSTISWHKTWQWVTWQDMTWQYDTWNEMTIRYGVLQCGTWEYIIVQYMAVRHSVTVHHSTVYDKTRHIVLYMTRHHSTIHDYITERYMTACRSTVHVMALSAIHGMTQQQITF